ncbi:MAG: hypothetical protein ABEJ83_05780 [Candidatus Nanohaloarchaea archaeon]
MNRDDFAEKAWELFAENKSDYTEDFQKWQEKGHLTEYDNEKDMIETLSQKFQNQGRIEDREELYDILYWKLNPRNYKSAKNKSEEKDSIEDIRKASERAFAVDEAGTSLQALTELTGVGPAVASTILMFYKPGKYTVLDQHAWRAAVDLGMKGEAKENGFTAKEYAQYNDWCHEVLHSLNEEGPQIMNLRQLDKVLHSMGKQLK